MQRKRSSNCCLWTSLAAGAIALIVCGIFAVATLWFGYEISLLPTATPMSPCEQLLVDMRMNGDPGQNIETTPSSVLVTYPVEGSRLGEPSFAEISGALVPLQKDGQSHRLIWEYFVAITPEEIRSDLTAYSIYSDGTGNFSAMVQLNWTAFESQNANSAEWTLLVDTADYSDIKFYSENLLHEIGHLLTLSIDQLDYREDLSGCPHVFNEQGCGRPDSYMQAFFDQFWSDVYDDWYAIASNDDPAAVTAGLDEFYNARQDQFVSRYAVTKPEEDLAETWKQFLLTGRPAGGDTLINQKILFFYRYPEFVRLKEEIDRRMCSYFGK